MAGDHTTGTIPELAQALVELSRRMRVLEDHVGRVETQVQGLQQGLRLLVLGALCAVLAWVVWKGWQ